MTNSESAARLHVHFHVTSSANRASITEHGLDWRHMGAAPGIAGSRRPENDGVFLCRDEPEATYFVGFNNTGGPVDVWRVQGVHPSELVDNGSGYFFVPRTVSADALDLLETDLSPRR